jgi:CubicO group peptidase (beta-lactamase class C family)
MDSTSYVLPESQSRRVVRRAAGLPLADPFPHPLAGLLGTCWYGIDAPRFRATPDSGGGVCSTPRDMAVFGQMVLNRGRYGGARILSPASVAAMTRDQVPGVSARLLNWQVEHASWGYGWTIESPSKWSYFHGSLQPLGTFSHSGAGGAVLWIDPANELVGAYFEVATRLTKRLEQVSTFDLFQNAITATVEN